VAPAHQRPSQRSGELTASISGRRKPRSARLAAFSGAHRGRRARSRV